jgi:hypothetical protein
LQRIEQLSLVITTLARYAVPNLRLQGLEALAMYEVNGAIYAGSTLMNVGMVSTFDGNYDSYVLWVRRVNDGNLGV